MIWDAVQGNKKFLQLERLVASFTIRAHQEHGCLAEGDHLLGDAANEKITQAAPPVRAHHHQVRSHFVGVLDDAASDILTSSV